MKAFEQHQKRLQAKQQCDQVWSELLTLHAAGNYEAIREIYSFVNLRAGRMFCLSEQSFRPHRRD